MKNDLKLSIILPVYNSGKYLKKCIYSILNSTYKNFELIIINDGSTDDSEKIILDFKEKFPNKIVYILKENSGVSDTRNKGIEMAKGQYIAFVDSDDYVEPTMFELMMDKLNEYDFDVVACDVKLVYADNNNKRIIASNVKQDLKGLKLIKENMISQYSVVWNKIYKTSIIKDLRFTKGVWYEDVEFLLKLYPKLSSIGTVTQPLYNYLQRENSITYTYNEKLYDIIKNMDNIINYYKENNLYNNYKEELEYLYARYALATFPKRLAKCKDKSKYDCGVKYALNKVKNTFPSYKNNIYLKKVGLKGIYIKSFNSVLANINFMIQNKTKYN